MLIAPALGIFFAWGVMAAVLIGIGSVLLRLLHEDFLLVDAFWTGLAVSTALLEIWHLLLRVSLFATLLLFGTGLLGLILNRSVLFSRFRTKPLGSCPFILLYTAIAFFTAFRAAGPCDYYDTGLYGATAVRWILTFPAVPGLANVHGRLGFNSSVFLWIAALIHGPWKTLAYHLLTGLMIIAIWGTLLPSCFRLIRKSSTSPVDWFYGILVIPVSFWTARIKIVGTLTDEPATIACLIATGVVFDELAHENDARERNAGNLRLLVATAVLALAVSFKETTAVFAALVWILAFRRLWSQGRLCKDQRKYALGAVALPIVILFPWCLQGVILSGYPFFPMTILGFPVDWRTPIDIAQWYAEGVRSFAQNSDVNAVRPKGFEWLGVWSNHALRNRSGFQVPLAISLGGLASAMYFRLRRESRAVCPWLWLLLPSVAAILFWFVTAPGLRLAQFAIWTAAGTIGTWSIVVSTRGASSKFTTLSLATILAATIWCLCSFGWKEPYRTLLRLKSIPPLPKTDTTARHTSSGLTIYVPVAGDQCWDATLPCTPYFDETLRLRNEQSMRLGFISKQQATALKPFE